MANNAKFEIEIYGNTASFENSLKGINTAMSSLKSEASGLRSALRLDPTNTTLMTKLQGNLATQLEQTKNKTAQLKTELSGIDKSTPDGQQKFLKLSKAIQDSETRAGYLQRDIQNIDNSISSGSFNLKLKTDEAESSLERVKTGFGSLKTIAVGALLEIGGKIANTVTNKFGDWIGGAVDTQKSMISLKNTMNFSGSGAEFTALSSRMQKLATDTNANASDTIKLATTFIGLGNSSEVAGNKVDNLVRANQAFGGTSEDLKGVALAYSQMSASGKVTAENINQLTDNNTALGASLKTTVMQMNPQLAQYSSFAEASEDSAISVDMLDQAMAKLGSAGGGGTETIKDSFDALDETISNALLPALDSITPIIVEIVNDIAAGIPKAAEAFKDMYNWIKENWDWLSKVLIIVGSLIVVFGVLNAIIAIFGVVMAVVTSPITLVVLAITALIAIGVLLWKNWQTVADFALSIWGGIKDFFSGLGTWFGELWTGIATIAQNAWDSITSVAGTVVGAIIAFFQPIVGFFSSIFSVVGSVVETEWELISTGASLAWNGIVSVFSAIGGFFSGIFNAVSSVVSSVFSAFGGFASIAWGGITGVFSGIGGFFSGAFSAISGIVSGVFSGFGNIAKGAYNAITGVFSGIGGFFSDIFGGVKQIVDNTLGGITRAIDGVKNTIGGITDKVKGVFGGSSIVEQRDFIDLKARGLSQNSASSVENRYNNTFTINSGNQDPTAIARAVVREIELGRA